MAAEAGAAAQVLIHGTDFYNELYGAFVAIEAHDYRTAGADLGKVTIVTVVTVVTVVTIITVVSGRPQQGDWPAFAFFALHEPTPLRHSALDEPTSISLAARLAPFAHSPHLLQSRSYRTQRPPSPPSPHLPR